MNDNIKSGVKLGFGERDWFGGANSPIVRDVLVADGDWKPYQIEHEIQWTGAYDTQFCVTFSALECIGSLFMYYIGHNLISADNVKWLRDNGYFKNGFINFNERFTAINGKTDENGAYQFNVANGIKNFGLIPQDMFPTADNFKDNINPSFITSAMYALGKEFLKRFSINYEWVDDFSDELKYGPIQNVVKFANYVNPTDILAPAGETNHAVEGVFATVLYNEERDTYWQIFKRYNPAFTYSYMSFKLTINNNNNMNVSKWLVDNDKKWVQVTSGQFNGQFGRVLQGKLMIVKTTDRGTLMLLDDKMRSEPSIKITGEEYDQLPKINF